MEGGGGSGDMKMFATFSNLFLAAADDEYLVVVGRLEERSSKILYPKKKKKVVENAKVTGSQKRSCCSPFLPFFCFLFFF